MITGAAGFLGAPVTLDLAKDHRVVALDVREPSPFLRAAAPQVPWLKCDIGDAAQVRESFAAARGRLGSIDLIIHLAAFYHFGADARTEYQRVNLDGTRNVIEAAIKCGAKRLIFASSQMALEPPGAGEVLTEQTRATSRLPYGASKAAGEAICREASQRLPITVLRIGGIFSDWCELPPLHSLMRTWGTPGLASRIVPGGGRAGFAYLHRDDLVQLVRRTIELHESLDRYEVLLASDSTVTTHLDIFQSLRRALGRSEMAILLPPALARVALHARCTAMAACGRQSFEQPWMIDFVDRPFTLDNRRTREKLDWDATPHLRLLERLPVLVEPFRTQRKEWERRNRLRNAGLYEPVA